MVEPATLVGVISTAVVGCSHHPGRNPEAQAVVSLVRDPNNRYDSK